MIPMLYTAEDIAFPAPSSDFGGRVLAAAIKHQLMLEVIGNPGAHILGRVTFGELAAFAAEFAAPAAQPADSAMDSERLDWLEEAYTRGAMQPNEWREFMSLVSTLGFREAITRARTLSAASNKDRQHG